MSYKARLIARDFLQVRGMDHGETFAPVLSFTIFLLILSLVASEDFELHEMDVKAAVL